MSPITASIPVEVEAVIDLEMVDTAGDGNLTTTITRFQPGKIKAAPPKNPQDQQDQEQDGPDAAGGDGEAQPDAEDLIDGGADEAEENDGQCVDPEDLIDGGVDDDEEDENGNKKQPMAVSGHWSGVLAPLGEFASTRDRRLLKPPTDGMLRVRPLPLPLYVQYAMDSGHNGAKLGIGKIDKVWIDGTNLMGEGSFDLDDPEGLAVARKVAGGYLRFVSVDLDDDTQELGCLGDDNQLADCETMGTEAEGREGIVFADWRLMGATIVGHPAYANAFISMTESPEAGMRSLTAAAVGNTGLPLAPRNTPWDGAAAAAALLKYATSGNTVDWNKYGQGFLYQAPPGDGGPKQGDFKLPFATIVNGRLMAVWNGINKAAGAVQGSRGGVDLPSGDVSAVRGKLASLYKSARDTFKDAGIQVPWAPVTKAAATFQVSELAVGQFAPSNWRPKGEWFEQPVLEAPTTWTVTPAGRVYGHLAQWDVCHVGVDSQCLLPPRSFTDYQYFRARPLQTDSGVVHVGLITMDTGHAELDYSASPAAAHYDNTGTMAAVVTCGEDEFGIWVAGQVLPHLTPDERLRLGLSGISGDWRAIRGEMELIAALAVNSEGFPKARANSTFSRTGENGNPYSLLGAGALAPSGPALEEPEIKTISFNQVDPTTASQRLSELNNRMSRARMGMVADRLKLSTTSASAAGRAPAPVQAAASTLIGDPSADDSEDGSDGADLPPAWTTIDGGINDSGVDDLGDGWDEWTEDDPEWADECTGLICEFLDTPAGQAWMSSVERWLSENEGRDEADWTDPNPPLPDVSSDMARVGGHPYGRKGENWITRSKVGNAGHLPKYIKRIVKHLQEKGMTQSRAIATAVNVVRKMCHGTASGGPGDRLNWPKSQRNVNAKSIAEACAAAAEWEAKKAEAHARRGLKDRKE